MPDDPYDFTGLDSKQRFRVRQIIERPNLTKAKRRELVTALVTSFRTVNAQAPTPDAFRRCLDTQCVRHGAAPGVPCWDYECRALCGSRIRRAGYPAQVIR